MRCPHCSNAQSTLRYGTYQRRANGETIRIPRYLCRGCKRTFSTQTGTLSYRERRPETDKPLFLSLCSGVSQRRSALLVQINRKTVAKKLVRMGMIAKALLEAGTSADSFGDTVIFDEMETFEHSKCKPLAIAIAVEKGSRRIIAAEVASMPAKGKLAVISRRRYGDRVDDRKPALVRVMSQIANANPQIKEVRSDQCPRYPRLVADAFPGAVHARFKGRRGCVVGQGELKAGGFDPLFDLNHTCAMLRDNLKTLSRRTWCTTKRPDRLQHLIHVYAVFHNANLARHSAFSMLDGAAPADRKQLNEALNPEIETPRNVAPSD